MSAAPFNHPNALLHTSPVVAEWLKKVVGDLQVHLDVLMRQLALGWSFSISELSNLSTSAVESRYPGSTSTRIQAEEAMDVASRVWSALRPLV